MLKPLNVRITTNWEILKEMEIPGHLTCLLRNLYADQEGTVRTGNGTMDWFQIGKRIIQGCILSPWLFNLYAEYIIRNARLDESQAGVHIAGRNIKGLRYADDTAPMAASEGPPDGSERGEWKSWLKTQHSKNEDHGIWSHLFMANRWGNNGKSDRLYFGGAPKSLQVVTAAIKLRLFLLGRKGITNLDSILKSRDITLPTRVHLVKAMVFPVVMYECESWTIKKAEH